MEFSRYLAKIIQPTLNKSEHKIRNFAEFPNKAKTWKISQSEIQISYDLDNLVCSTCQDIDVIVEYLKKNFSNVKTRTKLTLIDINQLTKLCVSEWHYL